jgi:hypothetical protein
MTASAAALIAERVAPYWLKPEDVAGNAIADATKAMAQRYLKADGKSLTQFNTGGLIVRQDAVIALTECEPVQRDARLILRPTLKSRAALIEDIRANGPPLLAVLFKKGAIDVTAWVCSTPDEVVINGPAGPEEIAAMEDVTRIRALPGKLPDWGRMLRAYIEATANPAQAEAFFAAATAFAAKVGMAEEAVLETLHGLRHASNLAFALAAQDGAA